MIMVTAAIYSKCFRHLENNKPPFSNSSHCLKSVFEKFPSREGLVWTVGITVEIKLSYQMLDAASVNLAFDRSQLI